MLRLVGFLCVLPAVVGATVAQKAEGTPLSFSVLEQGVDCGVKKQDVRVIRTRKALDDFLRDIGQSNSTAYSNTDWARQQLIVVFAGQEPTTGYGVDVKRVVSQTRGRTIVEARLTRPLPGSIVNPVITTPYEMIRTDKTQGAVQVRFLTD